MNRWMVLSSVLCLPFAASCFQKGPGPEGAQPPPIDAGDINTQCAPNSAACFTLCGSPECALPDAGLPAVLQTPPIWYQPGGSVNGVGASTPATTSADPCVAINDASQTIRKRSCGPCHTPGTSGATLTHFDYVLDDMTLAGHPDNANDGKIMVKPGDPQGSYVYQRVVTGLAGAGMPPADQQVVASFTDPNTLVYPTVADVSVLYAWILTCMPGANANAYQTSYGSGLHGPAANADGGVTGTD